ncbi:MAG: protein kinase [Chloroflexota bacterium]|nr:protein kinase [Chloroflexota bacterium]
MDQPTWIGRSLNGRYKISALLGQGGMSAVYKANDPNLKRVVAVKLIHPHLSTDPDFVYRFKKEAAAVAAFRHPNIVQVYDFNADGEVYYMVQEFIPGETLQERLKELKQSNQKMPGDQAIKIIIDICNAMGYAHKHGMIHRDIKPANIMLDVHGQAILMDFGIVKILDDESHTVTGAVVGTARYMSPETIRSEVPDERSDIYSLGVTFFEMLNGAAPFNADSAMSLMMRHLNDPVPDLRNLRPDVPPELVAIVNKSLEKDRTRRYRSADDMAADLRRVLAKLEAAAAVPPGLPATEEAATEIDVAPIISNRTDELSVAEETLSESPTIVEEAPVPPVQEDAAPVPPVSSEPRQVESPRQRAAFSPALLFGGGGILLLLLLLGGWYFLNKGLAASPAPTPTATPTRTSPPTATEAAVLIADTRAPTATRTPTLEPTATNTLPPLYVRINNITINNANAYVVEYETFGYTEVLPGQHVHFFFDTVPVEEAGSPGPGNWYLYGGPRPFDKYRVSDRPQGATQMCALVANANHTIIPETGNCFDLP